MLLSTTIHRVCYMAEFSTAISALAGLLCTPHTALKGAALFKRRGLRLLRKIFQINLSDKTARNKLSMLHRTLIEITQWYHWFHRFSLVTRYYVLHCYCYGPQPGGGGVLTEFHGPRLQASIAKLSTCWKLSAFAHASICNSAATDADSTYPTMQLTSFNMGTRTPVKRILYARSRHRGQGYFVIRGCHQRKLAIKYTVD